MEAEKKKQTHTKEKKSTSNPTVGSTVTGFPSFFFVFLFRFLLMLLVFFFPTRTVLGVAFRGVLPLFFWSLSEGLTEFYWVLLGFTGFYLVLLGFTGFYWVLPSFT